MVPKLPEVKTQIPGIKAKGVPHRQSVEFRAWQEKGINWLKLGLPHTSFELQQFGDLHFRILRMRAYGESGYDHDDHEQYVKDCGRAVTILESAIENIEMDLVPEAPDELQPRTKKTGGSKFGGVSIAQVGTAVMGDKNIFAKIDSINVFDFLKILEKEVQEKVQDPQQKATLLQKVGDISQNPAMNTILGQTIGQMLRSMMGQ